MPSRRNALSLLAGRNSGSPRIASRTRRALKRVSPSLASASFICASACLPSRAGSCAPGSFTDAFTPVSSFSVSSKPSFTCASVRSTAMRRSALGLASSRSQAMSRLRLSAVPGKRSFRSLNAWSLPRLGSMRQSVPPSGVATLTGTPCSSPWRSHQVRASPLLTTRVASPVSRSKLSGPTRLTSPSGMPACLGLSKAPMSIWRPLTK
mmetsp:Transcript_27776/g.50208  ORF Transcript_27776/g.50208 Transcript_27776/m.50208 type:complete len:208 (+) Transcript_27776:263-886(+)